MIRPDFVPVLPRNFLQAALLQLIGARPGYGYELRDELTAMGVRQHDFGQLYRTLRAMEKDGLVLSCWENSKAGPSRRTYHVTDKGRAQLTVWVEGMAAGQHIVERFLAHHHAEARESA
ncbi:MAG: PadR family transcriptional regulator [Acidimicrobiales bacterium]